MFARLFRRLNAQRPAPTLDNLRTAVAQLVRPEPCPYCYAYQRPPRIIGDHLARVHPLDALQT